MFVYKIITSESDKVYVGLTTNTLEERWKQHLEKHRKFDYPLYCAMRKYGVETFSIHLLEECFTREELSEREIFWGTELNALSPQGYSLKLGEKRAVISEETKKKISKSVSGESHPCYGKTGEDHPAFGHRHSEEWKQEQSKRLRERNLGSSRSFETRKKISESKKGKPGKKGEEAYWFGKAFSQDTRDKMSESSAKNMYYFISPDGDLFIITNIRKFCRDNPGKLDPSSMSKVGSGAYGYKSYKGWTRDISHIDNKQ